MAAECRTRIDGTDTHEGPEGQPSGIPVVETERLIVRGPTGDDTEAWATYLAEPGDFRYIPWRKSDETTLQRAKRILDDIAARWETDPLHWFDMDVAGPEIARVLEPDGILAGLWNVIDNRVDWVAALEQASGSAAIGPRDTLSSWRAETADAYLPNTGAIVRFGSPEQAEFSHGQRRTADSLVATLATRAGVLVMPREEQEATLGRIRAFLASRPETARGEFTLPMLTGVLRVRRL